MNKNKSEKWSIQISGDLTKDLKKYCEKNGCTMSGFIEKLIKEKIMNNFITIEEAKEFKNQYNKKWLNDVINQKAIDKSGVNSFFKVFKESAMEGKYHFEDFGFHKFKDHQLIRDILDKLGFESFYDEKTDKLTVEW